MLMLLRNCNKKQDFMDWISIVFQNVGIKSLRQLKLSFLKTCLPKHSFGREKTLSIY